MSVMYLLFKSFGLLPYFTIFSQVFLPPLISNLGPHACASDASFASYSVGLGSSHAILGCAAIANLCRLHSLLQLQRLIPFSCAILCSTIFIFVLSLVGVFYPYNRGALFTALVLLYALTSGIAGYTATSFYSQLEGTNWVGMLIYSI